MLLGQSMSMQESKDTNMNHEKPISPPRFGGIRAKLYYRQHLPTGEVTMDTVDVESRLQFLEYINAWNRSPSWKFWEVD